MFLVVWTLLIGINLTFSFSGATTEEYIIFPIRSDNREVYEDLAATIAFLAGGKEHVYTEINPGQLFPDFWTAKLSDWAFQALRKVATVNSLFESHTSIYLYQLGLGSLH